MVEVEHPMNAELIRQHAKARSPKRVLHGHADFAFFTQRGKQFVDFLRHSRNGR